MKQGAITIDARYCGPPRSGNGGYVAGVLAQSLPEGPSIVRLRRPPPLSRPLDVETTGSEARLLDGNTTVAEARRAGAIGESIDAPTYDQAAEAARKYRGFDEHVFPRCFVCGPEREVGDGLCIFPGPLGDGTTVAAPWVPHAGLADDDQPVAAKFVWAALDCPGAFSFPQVSDAAVVLGELHVELSGSIAVGERCVLAARKISQEGRKHRTLTAVFGESGACRGTAIGTWIEIALPDASRPNRPKK